jgi:hypothetical protein
MRKYKYDKNGKAIVGFNALREIDPEKMDEIVRMGGRALCKKRGKRYMAALGRKGGSAKRTCKRGCKCQCKS